MSLLPGVTVTTKATLDAWRHLAAVARAYGRAPNLEAERYALTCSQIARGGDAQKGGTGADVAVYGGGEIANTAGLDGGLGKYLERMTGFGGSTAVALQALARGDFEVYRHVVERMETTTPDRPMIELLAALGGLAALVDPDGTRRSGLLFEDVAAQEWSGNPRRVPDYRKRLLARLELPETAEGLAGRVRHGELQLFPAADSALESGALLCAQERERLAQAKLYHADADTCAVAVRKASRPRKTPLSAHRVPCPYGMVVFAEPIDFSFAHPPLVAASWGPFPETAVRRAAEGDAEQVEPSGRPRWWVSLYGHAYGSPPMAWSEPVCLTEADVLDVEAPADGVMLAARTVVAAWDLITQERVGKAVVEVQEERRTASKRRADQRSGVTDDSTVRLVAIRGRRPLPQQAAHRSEPVPGEGPARSYDRGRWWVTEHSRDHCKAPHLHQAGGCTHEDITILDYPKGPTDKPFLDTVHLLRPPADR